MEEPSWRGESQFRNHGKLSHLELRTTFNFILCTVRKNTCLCYCKNSLNKITFWSKAPSSIFSFAWFLLSEQLWSWEQLTQVLKHHTATPMLTKRVQNQLILLTLSSNYTDKTQKRPSCTRTSISNLHQQKLTDFSASWGSFVALGSWTPEILHAHKKAAAPHSVFWIHCCLQRKRHQGYFCSTVPPSHKTPCKSKLLRLAEVNVETVAPAVCSGSSHTPSRSLQTISKLTQNCCQAHTWHFPRPPATLPAKDNKQKEVSPCLLTLWRPQEGADEQVRPTLSLRTLLQMWSHSGVLPAHTRLPSELDRLLKA